MPYTRDHLVQVIVSAHTHSHPVARPGYKGSSMILQVALEVTVQAFCAICHRICCTQSSIHVGLTSMCAVSLISGRRNAGDVGITKNHWMSLARMSHRCERCFDHFSIIIYFARCHSIYCH